MFSFLNSERNAKAFGFIAKWFITLANTVLGQLKCFESLTKRNFSIKN